MRQRGVLRSQFLRRAGAFLLLTALLLPSQQGALAEGGDAADNLTSQCKLTLPERSAGFAARLSDNRYNSRISFKPEETLEVQLFSGAKGVYVAWYTAPEAALIEALDASGGVLTSIEASSDLLNDYYALPEGSARVRISGNKAFAISEFGVYDATAAPDALCVMSAQGAQPKVMLIAAHTGDEAYYFGSLLPFLTGKDAAVVFLSAESRQMQQQAIEGMYSLGCRTQPVFGNFQYYRTTLGPEKIYGIYDKVTLSDWFIRLLRRYQPETLITHSAEGEDNDGVHRLTATHTLLAVTMAADTTKEYVSEREYGVWQVQAVYQHMDNGSAPLYDTAAPISAFGGASANALAQTSFDHYPSFQLFHATVSNTPYFAQTYPDSAATEQESASKLYSILASLSGPSALPSAAATPEPTVTPEPEAEATAHPTQAEPTSVSSTAAQPVADGSKTMFYIGVGLVVLGAAVAAVSLLTRKKDGEAKAKAVRLIIAGVGCLLIAGGLILALRVHQPAAVPAATSAPTPKPTVTAPTETSTPAPTENPMASHFRQEGDPTEVVVFDYENGNFEYKTDTLGIEIKRATRTGPPVVYYVVHIYERGEDSYRSGFGSARQNGRDPIDACTMARRYRAVLGITGDNLLHSDYNRGMMIRDGRIFRAMTKQSAMALTDDLSMRIYDAGDPAMLNEIEDGTRATFAFGPPLVKNGVACENVDQDRVGRINPRVGLGLVEPGHYVAILVDGRLPRYSHGVLLSDFAKMFLDEGCTMAYNLDGGASASLVFMGEYLNHRADNHYRSVPDQLLWGYSQQVPDEDAPRVYDNLVPQDWAGN